MLVLKIIDMKNMYPLNQKKKFLEDLEICWEGNTSNYIVYLIKYVSS